MSIANQASAEQHRDDSTESVEEGHHDARRLKVRDYLNAKGIGEDKENEAVDWLNTHAPTIELYDKSLWLDDVNVADFIDQIERYIEIKDLLEQENIQLTDGDMVKHDVRLSDIFSSIHDLWFKSFEDIWRRVVCYFTYEEASFDDAYELVDYFAGIFERYEKLKRALETHGHKINKDSQVYREYMEDEDEDFEEIVEKMLG